MHEPDVKEIEKDLSDNFGPLLRSSKKKGEMSWRGQMDEIFEVGTLQNKMFFKVSSK